MPRAYVRRAAAGAVAIFTVTLTGLFFLSWSSLELTEGGLNFSAITQSVENEVYQGGRYMLGVGHSFIRFPATIQTIQFAAGEADSSPLRSRTRDGLEVELEISFQYKINLIKLYDMYMFYGAHYHNVFVRMATDVLSTAATHHTANSFFVNRSAISPQMGNLLNDHFKQHDFVHVAYFQLRTVSLPKTFEDAIQETEVKKQDIQTAHQEQQSRRVEYSRAVMQAAKKVEVLSQAGGGAAESVMVSNHQQLAKVKATGDLAAQGALMLLDSFEGDKSSMLEYMKVRAIQDRSNAATATISLPAASRPASP